MRTPLYLILIITFGLLTSANAAVIINNTTQGYYNQAIGTLLDGTDPAFPAPYTDDNTYVYASAPNIAAASAVLGNWLNDPVNLNANWSALQAIQAGWNINDETAIIYQIDAGTAGLNNVITQLGVDNGIFVWLDGIFQRGWRAAGGAYEWEYSLDLGTLSAGTHYLQILREDHGGATGYTINVTGDSAPSAVPEPGTVALLGLGLLGLGANVRKRNKA